MGAQSQVLDLLGRAWNNAGLKYSVLHGLERYPQLLGRDLDVCVKAEAIPFAMDLSVKTLRDCGWRVRTDGRLWASWIFAFRDTNDGAEGLEIDFLPIMQTGFLRLLEGPSRPELLFQRGSLWCDAWGGPVKRVLMQLHAGNTLKMKSRQYELALEPLEKEAVELMLPIHYPDQARRIRDAWYAEDLDSLETAVREAASCVQRQAFFSTRNWFDRVSFCVRRLAGLNLFPSRVTPIVALLGPDGVGKSTTLRALHERLDRLNVFPSPIIKHWRPNLLPKLQKLTKRGGASGSEGAIPPRRNAGRFWLARCLYYFLDYLLGSWLIDNRKSIRLVPILYDRHAIDMSIDPLRYGLSKGMPPILQKLIPKPGLVVALVDSPEHITARKAELSHREIQDQLDAIRKFRQSGDIDEVMEVRGAPAEMAEKILTLILRKFAPPFENGGGAG